MKSKIISIHSFRGGTGKSNITANLSALLAADGYKVGLIDTDIQSPGIHVLFGMDQQEIKNSLNDYLWGKCAIKDAAHDMTPTLGGDISGQVYLIPSSIKAGEIARVLREGYDISLLNDGFHEVIRELDLDILVIDTHPGLNEETLLSIAISDVLGIILRPDSQDYQGTGVTVEVARKLDVPNMKLIVNKVPDVYNFDEVRAKVQNTYEAPVAAVIPHSDEVMALASSGIFSMMYPDHRVSHLLKELKDVMIT